MRKIIPVVLLALVLVIPGCASFDTAVNTVEGFVTNTVVPATCALASYYQSYIQGAATLMTQIPGFPAVATLIISELNTAEDALNADCQSGALTAKITADVTAITNLINQYNSLAGQYAKAAGIDPSALDLMVK